MPLERDCKELVLYSVLKRVCEGLSDGSALLLVLGRTTTLSTFTSSKSQLVHTHFVHSQFVHSHFIQYPLHPIPTSSNSHFLHTHFVQSHFLHSHFIHTHFVDEVGVGRSGCWMKWVLDEVRMDKL